VRRFGILLRKELKELITPATLLPIVLVMILLVLVGNFMGDEIQSEIDKATKTGTVAYADRDDSELSKSVIAMLSDVGYTMEKLDGTAEENALAYSELNASLYIEIPAGFEEKISNGESANIEIYSTVSSFSISSSMDSISGTTLKTIINEAISNSVIAGIDDSADPSFVKNPVSQKDYTVFNGKIAQVSASELQSYMMMQTMFLPIVLFLIIMLASQMLANSVANEKTDKTLETLLSAPVGRVSILSAKMLAAGLVSLLYSVFYIVGYSSMMGNLQGTLVSASAGDVSSIASSLGLTMSIKTYALFGLQLFLSILVALSLSLLIGILADDIKKVQGLIMPMILLIMIPYLVSLFSDILSFSTPSKLLIGIIPFTHAFTATNAVIFGDMTWFWCGALYQSVVLVGVVMLCLKVIRSDLIFTLSGRLNRKTKRRKA